MGFGPAAWVYGSEIFPTNFRARGLNIAASGSSIGSIISSQTWPIGMNTIGSKTHFIFMSTNLASAIIICTSSFWRFFYSVLTIYRVSVPRNKQAKPRGHGGPFQQ